eukprot:CAMPEP_0172758106 /NCGR_PEP_ID=MMETSP1074-20121228/165121_1 /TAXON_ID=2916 /ORGANISM="Ceratium fusus, Strain PA161109" /LENGTH=67 /DNA_ID=CAMNT_0013591641 /DNA_START=15 /DNA_END=218 /DNA_ORIENTATION=+
MLVAFTASCHASLCVSAASWRIVAATVWLVFSRISWRNLRIRDGDVGVMTSGSLSDPSRKGSSSVRA